MVTVTRMPQHIENLLRQAQSESGVVGKVLTNEPDSINRFGFVTEYEDSSKVARVYRVAWDLEGSGRMYRDHKSDEDYDPVKHKGWPTYQQADLGDDFWMEWF